MHLHPLALCRHFQWCFCDGREIGRQAAGRAGRAAGRSVPTGMIIMTV
jgi:hypothetical protein